MLLPTRFLPLCLATALGCAPTAAPAAMDQGAPRDALVPEVRGDSAAPDAPPPTPRRYAEQSAIPCVPQRTDRGANFCSFQDAAPFGDGWIIVGSVWGRVTLGGEPLRSRSRENVLVVWTSASGEVDKVVTLGRQWNNEANHVSVAPDGTIWITGWASNGLHPSLPHRPTRPGYEFETGRPFLGALDREGTVLFTRDLTEPALALEANETGVVVVGNAGLVESFDREGTSLHRWQLPFEEGAVFVKAVIVDGRTVWGLTFRPDPSQLYRLVATRFEERGVPRAHPLGRTFAAPTVYATLVGDALAVTTTVREEDGDRAGWWLVRDEAVVWEALEPDGIQPEGTDDVHLRGVSVTEHGIATLVAYIYAGRTKADTVLIYTNLADGSTPWVASASQPSLGFRLHALIDGGAPQVLLGDEQRGWIAVSTDEQHAMSPATSLVQISVE